MLLVVDFNAVFSALVAKGTTLDVFIRNDKLRKFNFISPEFVLEETSGHKNKLLSFTKLSDEEFNKFFSMIKSQIEIIHSSEFLEKLPEAIKLDKKDSPYLALALKKGCPIFSGDKRLRLQTKVRVYSPKDLLNILGSSEKNWP